MPRRASKWVLHKTKNGWDLSKGGRYLYQGLASRADALRRLRNYYRAGEPVILEEEDGYRTNITNQLKRLGLL